MSHTQTRNDLDTLMELTLLVWRGRQRADTAAAAAAACAPLPALTADVAPPELRATTRLIDRSVASLAKEADRAAQASARAADVLADAAKVGPDREHCRRVTRALDDTSRAVIRSYAHAATAARLAAGIAVVFEPAGDDEPLWNAARAALVAAPLGTSYDQVGITLDVSPLTEVLLAGIVAHIGAHCPAFTTIEPSIDSDRFVQVMADDCFLVGSPSDTFLAADRQLSGDELRTLVELGYREPSDDDDQLNWHADVDWSAGAATRLALATMRRVHHLVDGDEIRVSATLAAHHPQVAPTIADPTRLEVDEPTIGAVADALAARVRDGIATVGLDRLWITVTQDGLPCFAHLGSNLDGRLFTEVTGDFYLDGDEQLGDGQRARLRALGWDDPVDDDSDDEEIQPRNHTRIWPSPVDVDTAAWHVVLTLTTVYGLDLDEPWTATVEPI